MSETPRELLLGKRVDVLDKGWIELQDLMGDDTAIVNAARVSYLGESKGPDRDKKLLFYLMQHRHTTPFEMVEFKFRVKCPIIVARQWMRHRMFCLSGDTEITFNRPDHWKRGFHTAQRGNKGQKFTLERLHRLWHDPVHHSKIKNMLVRVYNEATAEFTVSQLADVIYSGKKLIYEITTEKGKTLRCTADHLLLTSEGWLRLEDAVGLSVTGTGIATMSKECYVISNGETDPWRSFEWMKTQRVAGKSLEEIAEAAECSTHNIRKWLKIHGLQYTHLEVAKYRPIWNKGKTGYKLNSHWSEESKDAVRRARSGAKSNFWKGGISSDRANIGRWTREQAPKVHAKYNYTCQLCHKVGGKLHAHHVQPVVEYPELARDFENLITVCESCHRELHQNKEGARSRNGVPLTPRHDRIAHVRVVGIEDTYDLSIEGPHHNFIANGIVVHNSYNEVSRRYTAEDIEFYIPDTWRTQSTDNKQASGTNLESEVNAEISAALRAHCESALALYNNAINAGVAREMARMFLPHNLYTQFIAKIDAHNLMHFLRLRMAPDAQQEIRLYAWAIYEHFFKSALPWTAEAFEKYVIPTLGPLTTP